MPRIDLQDETITDFLKRQLAYKRHAGTTTVCLGLGLYDEAVAGLGGRTGIGRAKLAVRDTLTEDNDEVIFMRSYTETIAWGPQKGEKRPAMSTLGSEYYVPGLDRAELKAYTGLRQSSGASPARRMLDYHLGRQDLALTLEMTLPAVMADLPDPLLLVSRSDWDLLKAHRGTWRFVPGSRAEEWGTYPEWLEVAGVEVARSLEAGHLALSGAFGTVKIVNGRRVVREVEIPRATPVPAPVFEVYSTLVADSPELTPAAALEMAQALAA